MWRSRTSPIISFDDARVVQHGMIDDGMAISMFAAISAVPNVTPLAR